MMRTLYLALLLGSSLACSSSRTSTTKLPQQPVETATNTSAPTATFLLGTTDGEHAPGIYRYTLYSDGTLDAGIRVGEASKPTYLAYSADRQHVLAVEELDAGRLATFAVQGDTLIATGRQDVGGGAPCHVSTSGNGLVGVANYSGGNVALFRLGADGSLSERLDLKSHNTAAESAAHAHSFYFVNNDTEVVSADLGTGDVWRYGIDADAGKLVPQAQTRVAMASGAGPRHLAFHNDGQHYYAINEINSTLTLIEGLGTEQHRVVASYSTLPQNFTGDSFCADVHLSRDGRFLYASNRGHNSIAVFAVDPIDATLTLVEHESTAGDWPRNFALSPSGEYLLVANQRSNSITTLRRDSSSGKLSYVAKTNTPTPMCILF